MPATINAVMITLEPPLAQLGVSLSSRDYLHGTPALGFRERKSV
jgi:hypothetical protein